MMAQQLQASVVTAPLAQIDRRALSQAWYSALHVARAGEAVQALPRTATPIPFDTRRPVSSPARESRASHARRTSLPFRTPSKPAAFAADGQRRTLPPLVRGIARALVEKRTLPIRSTVTLGEGAGRVHVVLQSDGGRLRLIAICRPADRAIVARALTQARLALIACC